MYEFSSKLYLAKFQKCRSCSNFPKSIKISIFIKAIDLQNLKKYKISRLFQFCKNCQNIKFYQDCTLAKFQKIKNIEIMPILQISPKCEFGKDNMSLIKVIRAGTRAVDLGGESLKLSTKATVLKRASLLIRRAKHVDWGAWPPLGVGPEGYI